MNIKFWKTTTPEQNGKYKYKAGFTNPHHPLLDSSIYEEITREDYVAHAQEMPLKQNELAQAHIGMLSAAFELGINDKFLGVIAETMGIEDGRAELLSTTAHQVLDTIFTYLRTTNKGNILLAFTRMLKDNTLESLPSNKELAKQYANIVLNATVHASVIGSK